MPPFAWWAGDVGALANLLMGLAALLVLAPLSLALIRLLNRTLFDPDWRRARQGEREGRLAEEQAPAPEWRPRGTGVRKTS